MTLTDTFLISTDDTKTGIFTGSTRIRLECHACKAGNHLQLVAKVLDECLITLGLVFRYQRVNVHEAGIAQRSHFLGGIQLHGTRAERNHGVCQRNVLAFQTLDIAHHFCFCMILVEHFVSEE